MPPEPTFELPEDVVGDPAEELRAMRHNCCEEMPAADIKAAIQAEPTTQRPQQRRKHARSPGDDRSR